jgi:hypothetical protein
LRISYFFFTGDFIFSLVFFLLWQGTTHGTSANMD